MQHLVGQHERLEPRLGIPDGQVGVEPGRDGALLVRQPVQLRRVRGGDLDELLRRDPARQHAAGVQQRDARLDARKAVGHVPEAAVGRVAVREAALFAVRVGELDGRVVGGEGGEGAILDPPPDGVLVVFVFADGRGTDALGALEARFAHAVGEEEEVLRAGFAEDGEEARLRVADDPRGVPAADVD